MDRDVHREASAGSCLVSQGSLRFCEPATTFPDTLPHELDRVVASVASEALRDTGPSWAVTCHREFCIQELLRNGRLWQLTLALETIILNMGILGSALKIRSCVHLRWGVWMQGELLWCSWGTGTDSFRMVCVLLPGPSGVPRRGNNH